MNIFVLSFKYCTNFKLQVIKVLNGMGKLKEYSDTFENLSEAIVKYLLRDVDAEIIQTKSKKDGGYDIVVKCQDGNTRKCALFECKLRNANLNLRDIAANVIIAFNHGAVSFIAIANYNFTKQTGEELIAFCQNTVLNIKIIIGEELKQLLQKSCIDVTDELYNCISEKKTMRSEEFKALRINFKEDIVQQIFPQKRNYNLESNLLIEKLFPDEITYISAAVQMGKLIAVTGYMGVGKHQIIQEAFEKINKRIIEIDATLHATKDLLVLDLLAKIWGLPTTRMFKLFSEQDIDAIVEMVGDKNNEKDTKELLTAILNEKYAVKQVSEWNNILLCNYIINLLTLHIENVGFVIYIRKLQFASEEIYDFLIYFIKYIAEKNIGCVISYDIPEYTLQDGKNPLDQLRYIDQFNEYTIKLLTKDKALLFILQMYPKLSGYVAELIVSKVGTRFYNLFHLLKTLFPNGNTYTLDSSTIIQKLQFCSPNNVPSLLSQSLKYYNDKYSVIFRICYLFECQVPLELFDYIGESEQNLDHLIDAGLFVCNSGLLIAQNEFVKDWIMHAYTYKSPSIYNIAKQLKNCSKETMYDIRYINIYHVLDCKEDAIRLIEKNINTLKKEKQYSSLRKGLLQAIDIANSSCDRAQEIKYLIELLEIITIQKEVTTDEAKIYIDRLDYYSQSKILSLKEECALSFFKIKREFKLGTYTKTSNCAIELAKSYYDNCVNRIYTDNTNDWLGRICSCYALLIKSTQGNESALKIFESALKIFPTSFDLRREYWIHIGCMHLFDDPLKSYQNYQQILTLFKEAPDSAAFPFHEYGDLALCQLVAHDFPMAYLLTKDALKIGYANGVLDEEGRCLNIRGCIEWCQGNLSAAEASFHEAITIMQYSEYNHYLWRSQLNILQLSLITGNYSAERYSILEMVYTNFFDLLAVKINALSKLDSNFFRKTIEYHALIILGVLLDQITDNKRKHLKICDEFNLGKHDTLYQKDVTSFLTGNYYFIDSPYIQHGYIFFVG